MRAAVATVWMLNLWATPGFSQDLDARAGVGWATGVPAAHEIEQARGHSVAISPPRLRPRDDVIDPPADATMGQVAIGRAGDVSLATGRISGVLFRPLSSKAPRGTALRGEVVAGEVVWLRGSDVQEETASTDVNGEFSFSGLHPGIYWVLAQGAFAKRVVLTAQQNVQLEMWRSLPLAADSFEALKGLVRPGLSVRVLLATGEEVEGHLTDLSPNLLVLSVHRARREIAEADIWQIDMREPGYWWKGPVIGATLGTWAVTLPVLAYANGEEKKGNEMKVAWGLVAGVAAGAGALVGLFTRGFDSRQLLFERDWSADGPRVQLSPVLSRHAMGAALSLDWK